MIYFVRHGATDWNENKDEFGNKNPKCQGRADLPLNEKGITQAKATSVQLKDKKFDRIICSPLLRTKQTCEIIYKGDKPIEFDNRVIERDFGEFEGLTRKEFDFLGFWNAKSNTKFQKAESLKDVKKRVFPLLDELKKAPDKDYLIVSHGGVGCVLASYFKGVPADGNYLSFEFPHGKPIIFEFQKLSTKEKSEWLIHFSFFT